MMKRGHKWIVFFSMLAVAMALNIEPQPSEPGEKYALFLPLPTVITLCAAGIGGLTFFPRKVQVILSFAFILAGGIAIRFLTHH